MKKETFCPICYCGDEHSTDVKICWECQKEMMPDMFEDDEIEHPSVADYNGFIHQIY